MLIIEVLLYKNLINNAVIKIWILSLSSKYISIAILFVSI